MSRLFTPLCLAGILAATACQALDLTPRFVTRVTGAGSMRIPYFIEATRRYTLNLASDMTAFEQQGGLCILFNRPEGASLLMKPSPFSAPLPAFAEDEVYRKQALQALPPEAQEVAPRQESSFSLSLPETQSLGIVHAYKLPGRRFIQAVSFVNYSGEQQIMLVLTAPADSFDKALLFSTSLLRSWRAVGKGEDLSAIPTM